MRLQNTKCFLCNAGDVFFINIIKSHANMVTIINQN